MKRSAAIFFLIFLIVPGLFATHNRAGEITFELISGFTYRVTVTTFTYTKAPAFRNELLVEWGDNTSSVVIRVGAPVNGSPDVRYIIPQTDYYHNTYIGEHTFPGPGVYQILMQDPNRNYGINNIPNSVNVIFSVKTTFIISPEVGNNNSPKLLNYPIDKAALGHVFIHNPAAYDPDGDSLSYKITVCTGQDGKPIQNYVLPASSDTILVDQVTGDLIWNTPIDTGKYNVAMNIEEWRKGIKIGNITRDMQINVYETENNPPVNPPLNDLCVKAGTFVELQLTSTDADNDSVHQMMQGGPFVTQNPATFSAVAKGRGFTTSIFRWQTTCDHIRKQPWQLMLKSQDINSDIQLVDIDNFNIRVLAPAPQGLTTSSTSNEISLSWNQSHCGAVAGYYIYRREGNYVFNPDSCETGVPAYAGYTRIGMVNGIQDTVFVDDNQGEGLVQGIDYCYVVTAFYADGNESFASEPSCNLLIPGFPSLLNVSVTNVDAQNGSIFLSWAKPRNFDMVSAPGPYVFKIYRSLSEEEAGFTAIDSIFTSDLNDTVYTDTPLNTEAFPYYYKVRMFNNTPGNRFEMRPGESETASSLYMIIEPGDNQLTIDIRKRAPWVNEKYLIFRRHDAGPFVFVDTVETNRFTDAGLVNGQTYTYQVQSIGWRPIDDQIFNNTNLSHYISGLVQDLTAPCPPVLYVKSNCDSSATNLLTWTNPNHTCADDVVRYNIYYAPDMNAGLDSLTSTQPATDTSFIHHFEPGVSLSGCYAVTAIDSFGNESIYSTVICVDQCSLYSLPNVFTPMGNDRFNNIYRSNNVNQVVEKVDMKIFNRYGQLVMETSDPDINWDGSYKNDGKNYLSSGVYYYICDVYEPRLNGVQVRTLIGFIHLFAGDAKKMVTE